MEIQINKNELASALPALGKLITRTAVAEVCRSVEIRGFANHLYFRTRTIFEEIEFALFAEMEEDFPTTLVFFEQFRSAVRNSKNKTLKFEYDCGAIYIDGVMMESVKGHFPLQERISNHIVSVIELPADTMSAFDILAPITAKGTVARRILTGINIGKDGFTATNEKELVNIPVSLETTDSITIPFPLVLLATKAYGESGKLSTWQKDGETFFELMLGNWSWRTKALPGIYPIWKHVVPERTDATHYVCLQDESAEQMTRYLKSITDEKDKITCVKLCRLPEGPNMLHLESSNGLLVSISAEFDPNWDNLSVMVRKDLLLHLLNAGHRKIELNDAFSPIVGTGGAGLYIGMPLRLKKAQPQTEQKPEQVASCQTNVQATAQSEQPASHPVTEATESVSEQNPTRPQETKTIIHTNLNKENPTMNAPIITRTVSVPEQTSTLNNKPESKLNSMDELIISIEAFKAKLKAMLDESNTMSRKVCEVAIAQKQKEREYARTKRTLERVRVATGAA